MQDEPMSFTFSLAPPEIAQIASITVVGTYAAFYQRLRDQLKSGDIVTFDCREFGELLWHMSGGKSEFQIRLRRAFIRSVYTLFAVPNDRPDLLR
jgi:hypothetical protein